MSSLESKILACLVDGGGLKYPSLKKCTSTKTTLVPNGLAPQPIRRLNSVIEQLKVEQ